ncbi:MAG: intradiol ring-cleavage dioxygenase [Alphaproteobacteria bacterium]|nr:intradiol ring-cleavage dioxygenase [Alphaproteobacteria bacterium]
MPSRRHVLLLGTGGLIAVTGPTLAQPLACTPGIAATERQTEGPFFRGGSPLRVNLAGQLRGERVNLDGVVMARACQPVRGAIVDIWHADSAGDYDNRGYELRGHQITDERGAWRFETIAPGRYPGRTPHYHVKVTPPGGRTLTTQLYFPGDPDNARDGLYKPSLQMRAVKAAAVVTARFDFIVEA